MKLSDFFTTIRIVLAPIFFIVYFLPGFIGFGANVSVFILIPLFIFMEFTDFLDGYYARKHQVVSDFGKVFDPFADVLANLTVMFAFVVSGYLPAILFLIIIYREFGMSFVRQLSSKRGVAIAARKGGKAKTVLYIVAAGFSLAIESAIRLGFDISAISAPLKIANIVLYVLAVIASLVSFIDYLIHFPGLFGSSSPSK
ncbi:MAG TPA: CDP-diacylglycerol--glycerol-3-phosphate 3-phosphatidyltransferase [Treponemataceae bacterium]|nr:CDP-diacylglycerol--glycerol-3-phosphate 3-phosphatidyltransferase [Treponemataceae bacterium]HPS44873.1 CDP-diacylglycerol--glycerol-3-phosphate 3-phosphatidyltransferase [Treponemataceae bacterium]